MSTFNAGAIEANLTLGRSNWVRDLKKTQKEIQDLERKSITIGVDLDTDNARVSMDNLEMFLDDLDQKEYAPSVDLIVREAMQALEALEARLDLLDARRVVVEIDADADNAEVVMDNIETFAMMLDGQNVTLDIRADARQAQDELIEIALAAQRMSLDGVGIQVDIDGYAKAITQLNILESQVDILDGRDIDIDVDIDRRALNGLVGAAGGDGSGGHLGLLRILIYSLIALSPILAVAMSSATAALVAFMAAAAGAAGAVAVLGIGLFGLVKRYKDAKEAGEAMTGPMGDFADAMDELSKAWNSFLDQIEDSGFELMANAIGLLADILPTLAPLFNLVAEAMGGVVDGIRGFVESSEYQEMLDFFGGFGVDMLESFLQIGGNLLRFFGRLFQAIEPFARQMMQGLEDVTAGWMEWADDLENNDSFQQFMDNAAKYGPMVLDMLGSLIQAFMALGRALEPFAGPMLEGLTFLFDVIAEMPQDLLTGIIAGLAGLWLGLHVLAPLISTVVGGLGALSAAIGIGVGPILLIAAAVAGLVATFVYLWKTNEDFRNSVIDTWSDIKGTIQPIIEEMVALFKTHWTDIQDWLAGTFEEIQNMVIAFVDIITGIINIALAVISFVWDNWGEEIKSGIVTVFSVIGNIIKTAFGVFAAFFKFFGDLLHGRWDKLWDDIIGIAKAFGSFLLAFWGGLGRIIGAAMTLIGSILRDGWNAVWGKAKELANDFWNWIKNRWNALIDWFGGLGNRINKAVSGMWDGIGDTFRDMINGIISLWNDLSFTINIPDKIPGLPDEWVVNTPNIPLLAHGAYLTEPTLNVAGEAGPEIVAPEPVLERIVRENSGGSMDYGRLAAAVAAALATVLQKIGGGVTADDLERLIDAASVNLNIDARSDGDAAGKLAAAVGYELRLLGYGGKANV